MSAASGAVLAAAMAAQRQREQEEEKGFMGTNATVGMEYKIIRTGAGGFRNAAWFRSVLDEEHVAGWDLVEKLDNCRARLGRPIECRQRDRELGRDAYRIYVGMGGGALAAVILGVFFFLFITVLMLIALLVKH